jgi:hypothetical protein
MDAREPSARWHRLPDLPFSWALSSGGCQSVLPQKTGRLLDHLVGDGEQRWRHVEAERICGLQVDDQLEFSRLLDWKRSSPFEFSRSAWPQHAETGLRGGVEGNSDRASHVFEML